MQTVCIHKKITQIISILETNQNFNNEIELYLDILEVYHLLRDNQIENITNILDNIRNCSKNIVQTPSDEVIRSLINNLNELKENFSPEEKTKPPRPKSPAPPLPPTINNSANTQNENQKQTKPLLLDEEQRPKRKSFGNTDKLYFSFSMSKSSKIIEQTPDNRYVEVVVISARNLPSTKNDILGNPYVIVSLGNKKFRTKVIQKTGNPLWKFESTHETFIFTPKHIHKAKKKEIVLKCMGNEKYKVDTRLGVAIIDLNALVIGNQYDDWYPLQAQKPGDIIKGEIHIKVKSYIGIETHEYTKPELWEAVDKSDLEKVIEILGEQYVKWDERGENGETILHIAAQSFSENSPSILMELLNQEGSNVNLIDSCGCTPFHSFCKLFRSPDCNEIFYKFLSKGVNVNQSNLTGETPLHYAILNRTLKHIFVDLLLINGAEPNKSDGKCDPPIFYAVHLGREDLVKLLIAHGADCDIVGLGGKDIIELSNSLGYEDMAATIRESIKLREWLNVNGFGKYLKQFLEENIYIYIIPHLTDNMLKNLLLDKQKIEEFKDKAENLDGLESYKYKKEVLNKHLIRQEKQKELEQKLKSSLNDITPEKTSNWEIKIDEIEFVKLIGKGNYGEVYKGFYKMKPVAIKVFKVGENPKKLLEDFKKEFSVLVKIKSPYIVHFEGATVRKKLSIVMENCKNGSLFSVLRDSSVEIGWDKVIMWTTEIMKAIQDLHSHQPPVMHRDLKTQNVLVTNEWHCKICDFGLSRFDTPSNISTLTRTRGTYEYIAPELGKFGRQIRYTKKADIYSSSIILWELVNCILRGFYEEPYQEYNYHPYRVFYNSSNNGLRPTIPKDCPELVKNLIVAGWDDDPDKRPSAEEFQQQVELIRQQFNKENWPQKRNMISILN